MLFVRPAILVLANFGSGFNYNFSLSAHFVISPAGSANVLAQKQASNAQRAQSIAVKMLRSQPSVAKQAGRRVLCKHERREIVESLQ